MRAAAGLALLLVCVAASAGDAHPRMPLSEARWLLPGPQRLARLSTAPVECYKPPQDAQRRRAAEIGRVAFRTPLLLGGPAAKAGLSCQSCHVNGHDNPAFHLDGLSGAPGTVDVSSDLFSKTRGDGVFNPIPIPSLVERVQLRRRQGAEGEAALLRFVHGVIVDEFQGAVPAPVVFDALLAYIASLDPHACPAQSTQAITLADDWRTIERGADALQIALQSGDKALADFLVLGLRSLLGHVNERFDIAGLDAPRARLLALSLELGRIRELIPDASAKANAALVAWRVQLRSDGRKLATDEKRSLYDRQQLRRSVQAEGGTD